MAKLLKLRRGTTAQHASFTGAEGEVTIDTTKDTAVVHDGAQAGGRPLAREDMSNVSSASIAGQLGTDSIAVDKIAAGTLPSDVKVTDSNVSGNLTIESADIVDGTIVNADINASANIANSKLADSGVSAGSVGSSTAIPIITVNSKGIVTGTSTTAIDSTTIANGSASVAVSNNGPITSNANHDFSAGIDVTGVITGDKLVLEDDGSASPILNVKTDDNSPWGIRLGNDSYSTNDNYGMMAYLSNQGEGNFHIRGDGAYKDMHFTQSDGSTNKIVIKMEADDQSAELYAGGSKKFETTSTGATVTGNLAVTGTVDGVDVANLKTAKDSLSTSNGVLLNGVTATTQAASDNSTKVATTAFVGTAVSNLVDSSPSALNTLNELAAAINDDANFSTTVTNNIATKMPLAGGEFTGDVTCHNITPDGDSSRNLGTNSVRFANIYADNFVGSGANLTGIESFVSGMILLWSGSTGSIPSGFVLCNGSNSTPDLRDRFVVGAGNSYSVGATGGSNTGTDTVNISGSDTVSITVSGTAEAYTGYSENSTHFSNSWNSLQRVYYNYSRGKISLPFSGTGTDTVNISGSDTVSIDNRPPYYALCYIMKT